MKYKRYQSRIWKTKPQSLGPTLILAERIPHLAVSDMRPSFRSSKAVTFGMMSRGLSTTSNKSEYVGKN